MITQNKKTEGEGFGSRDKKIHEASTGIIHSVLQETQYRYPFKSSVREIVSNGLDSVEEKLQAIKILKKEINEEDVFINKEGSEFEDSKFDSSYYNINCLNLEENNIDIIYIENDTSSRDRIKFIDHGVGLGKNRLVGYFDLGFSTKRLSKNQLGNYGLGAKSLLATGVDKYTITSVYNNKKYVFDIYKDHIDSIVPKFNEDGSENKREDFLNKGGEIELSCYYIETSEKNKVTIEAEVKRHRKKEFINAVESQLSFIKNINFYVVDKEDYLNNNLIKKNIYSKIIFKNDYIIVGEEDYYAKPQLLLRSGTNSNILIAYGKIDFQELEMKEYKGSIFFIMDINEVDVPPSRESVIWNSRTRKAIKKMFEKAEDTALQILQDNLKEAKFLSDFLYVFTSLRNSGNIAGLRELYRIVDSSKISPRFKEHSYIDMKLSFYNALKGKSCYYNADSSYNNDLTYNNSLSFDHFSKISRKNTYPDTFIYIGETKHKRLHKYIKKQFAISSDTFTIITIEPEEFERIKVKDYSVDAINDEIESKDFLGAFLSEVLTYIDNNPKRVLYEEDIDKKELSNVNAKSTAYSSYAENLKAQGKFAVTKHSSNKSGYRSYMSEEDITSLDNVYIYRTSNSNARALLEDSNRGYSSFTNNLVIIGLSEDNFKKVYKNPKVKLFVNSLYTIKFGNLSFTELGKLYISNYLNSCIRDFHNEGVLNKGEILDAAIEKSKKRKALKENGFYYIADAISDINIQQKKLNDLVFDKKRTLRDKKMLYLKE